MKTHKLAFLIGIILFIIPFFWLKAGEMNLGGDAGRLYFYDPKAFLNYTLYNFIPSGKGVESIGYVFLPYTFVLFLLKFIFQSPTTLIAIFNGLILSVAFLSVYFIVRELIGTKEFSLKDEVIAYPAMFAGGFYIFSQELIYGGWEVPLITHNQLFLNPLMFLLLLKYFLTRKYRYVIIAILVSLIFATNFAYVGAPTFFAFYPLSLLFLVGYTKFIRKSPIPYKGLFLGILLFSGVHSFHLFPELVAVFSFASTVSNTVFSVEGALSRGGLEYFIAIAASTKVGLVWLSAAQFQKGMFLALFMLFPLTLIIGLLFNKGKTMLLTALFFLITMFFASANITEAGLFIYKQLFRIPGFSMFRNFHGQWSYVFIFFYALLFGQALAIILHKFKKNFVRAFLVANLIIIISFGIPLVSGAASIIKHADGLRYAFRMDPVYEDVLKHFRQAPTDTKVLTLPLTGPGYQVFQGKDGGLYQGLPTIPYLAGKSDFSGFESFAPFYPFLLEAMKNKNYGVFNRILTIMNIEHIYYNSDPFIYNGVLKGYLYDFVSQYSPSTQEEYKDFIEKLPVVERTDFGDKYHIYSLGDNNVLPHIFTTSEEIYTNDSVELSANPHFSSDSRMTPMLTLLTDKNSTSVLYGIPNSPLFLIKNNIHLHRHEPFISVELNSPTYPLTLLKEKYQLYKIRNDPTQYLYLNLFFISKRVLEVVKFEDTMDVLNASWEEPKIWEIYKSNTYNSWEGSITRYEKGVNELIAWVEGSNRSEAAKQADRIKINEQLFKHEIDFLTTVKHSDKKNEVKTYLYSLVEDMFKRLFQKVNVPLYTPSEYTYSLPSYKNREGDYEVYFNKRDISSNDFANVTVSIGNESLKPLSINNADEKYLLKFNSRHLDQNTDQKLTVLLPQPNLAKDIVWDNSGKQEQANGVVTLTVNNSIDENTTGLMASIPGWTAGKKYLISFDYLTFGDDFIFSFRDKKKANDTIKKFSYKLFFEKKLSSTEWMRHQSFVSAEDRSIEAFLQISAFPPKNTSTMQIKNLSITEIQFPQVLFKKIIVKPERHNPQIQFTKINPTKYKINVINVNGPYRLVFLESFNLNWKLIDPDRKNESLRGLVARLAAKILESAVGLFIPDRKDTDTVTAEYFNGEVKEGTHRNTFLEKSTFETWGMLNIAEPTHAEALGYANTWFITPEDMNGRTEYTLILEMRTQKQFYLALAASIVTLTLLVIYIIRSGFRKHAKDN